MTKLEKKIIIKGRVIAETGLLIGGSNSAMEIGGTDKQVVRNPINKKPYIPGSSLKGKMRSLLELAMGQIGQDMLASHNPKHISAQLFGYIKNNEEKKQQPSRVIVRDGELLNGDKFSNTELLYTEVKAENSINRITAEANPRFFERVPKGAEFSLEIIINVFEQDINKDNFLAYIFSCLRLVQHDYLGGCGSRGNGQVSFQIDTIDEYNISMYKEANAKSISLNTKIPQDLKAKN